MIATSDLETLLLHHSRYIDIAIRLRVGHYVVQVPAVERDLSSPKRPERRWGPTDPPFGVYRELFPREKAAEA